MEGVYMGSTYGYIRVSSTDQNEERQRIALRGRGVPESCIYMDKQYGKELNRAKYKRTPKKSTHGNTTSIQNSEKQIRQYKAKQTR